MEVHCSTVLDKVALLDRLGGDLELLGEITGLLLEDCPKLMTEIRSALSRSDPRALERSAHTLKGCVANFGALAAYEAALQLEKMGRASELDYAAGACDALELEMQRFQQALNSLSRELAQG